MGQAGRSHQRDVRPRDRQDARRTVRCRRHRSDALLRPAEWIAGQERRQVGTHGDRSNARATATVRDAERLVEVEVAHIGTEAAGTGHADERVEVGAIDVDLPAGIVHRGTDLTDRLLEDAVRRGVGDHDRRHSIATCLELGVQISDVDVPVGVGGEDDDLEPGHHRAGGVRAVRAGRDQADRAVLVTVGAMEGPDGEEAGELALTSGVGLDAHRVVAGHLGEPGLQLGDQLAQPVRAVIRREGVQVGELRPRDRLHLRRGVELHRARSKWDHRPVEGQVLVGEASQVPEHLVLGVIAVEHGLVQELVVRRRRVSRPSGASSGWSGDAAPNAANARSTTSEARRLVEGEADAAVVDPTEIDVAGAGGGEHRVGVDVLDGDRVEPRVVAQPVSLGVQPCSGDRGVAVRALGDPPQALGTVPCARTDRRCWRAGPGRCRCWRSPAPVGCAARGSAAPSATPAAQRCPY